ncbi:MAG: hypothetical protein ACR2JF_05980 [Iamia sp.]
MWLLSLGLLWLTWRWRHQRSPLNPAALAWFLVAFSVFMVCLMTVAVVAAFVG